MPGPMIDGVRTPAGGNRDGGSGRSVAPAQKPSANATTGGPGDFYGGGADDDKLTPWQEYVVNYVEGEVMKWVERRGLDVDSWMTWYAYNINDMLAYVDREWYQPSVADAGQNLYPGWEHSPGGLMTLGKAGFSWLQNQDHTKAITPAGGVVPGALPRFPGGGGGRGRGGPTAADFDLDELTEGVQNMWRAYLLTENPNARSLAQQYVNAIVSNPNKKLDFTTFVLGKIRGTSRHRAIYSGKPEHMEEREFMSNYMQIAMQYLQPGNADDVAIMGAQMGADPTAFRGLVSNQREVRNTSPWITGFENRLTELKGLFRG